MGHSLKISKSATTDSAAWISTNMCDIWSPKILKNNDINLGAWVRTQGVNTNPTTDDQKWYIMYSFWDSAGAKIADIKLPVDQTTATSSGWLADTNDVGAAILPKDAWTLIVKFVGGANATGTVWADNFILYTRGDQPWLAGQDWNTSVGVPTGWYYWLPPNGGNDGLLQNGFENTVVTTEAAHTGLHSLKFDMLATHLAHDGFVGTTRYLFKDLGAGDPISEGDVLRISVWIKASNLVPDSAAKYPGTWSVGFTPLWFTGNDNHLGYSPVGPANDYTWAFPPVTSFDWTQYTLDVTVPSGVGAQALEVRLHVYAQFVGTIYFDDLKVEVIGTTLGVPVAQEGMPKTYELENNYPNPFNPSTVIRYGVPRSSNVSLIIYNILGQQVRNLVQAEQPAGHYDVVWNGRDDAGQQVGSGMYLYRLAAGQVALTKKMLLLK
jgi:hypothetical protein